MVAYWPGLPVCVCTYVDVNPALGQGLPERRLHGALVYFVHFTLDGPMLSISYYPLCSFFLFMEKKKGSSTSEALVRFEN